MIRTTRTAAALFHLDTYRHFRLELRLPGGRLLEVNRFPGMAAPRSRVDRGRHSFGYWGDWEVGLYRAV
jgi:hypothetical protein